MKRRRRRTAPWTFTFFTWICRSNARGWGDAADAVTGRYPHASCDAELEAFTHRRAGAWGPGQGGGRVKGESQLGSQGFVVEPRFSNHLTGSFGDQQRAGGENDQGVQFHPCVWSGRLLPAACPR